ncbi:MAG: DUF892 family protein [Solirubrobacteraceae bacterium]
MLNCSDGPIIGYLTDIHAVERLDLRLLEAACRIGADRATAEIYADHLLQTRGHVRLIEERLAAYDVPAPARTEPHISTGPLRIGLKLVTGHSPADLAISIYTLESLEIALYHILGQLARHSHDPDTELVAQRILEQEEDAAELVASRIDRVNAASIDATAGG